MNLCCRSIGGNISDHMMKRCGMQGRLLAQTGGLLLEGVAIIVFSKCTTIGSAMPVMVVFSALVQAVEGMTFGIVPYVDPANLGAVCGVVGAWGNIGAVIFSWLFREFYSEQARFESRDDDDDDVLSTTTIRDDGVSRKDASPLSLPRRESIERRRRVV